MMHVQGGPKIDFLSLLICDHWRYSEMVSTKTLHEIWETKMQIFMHLLHIMHFCADLINVTSNANSSC